MGNLFKKIEDAFAAVAFAEAGEHEFARSLLANLENSHKKILLSTDCPLVTTEVLNHAIDLCKRLGSPLEVYQIFPGQPEGVNAREYLEQAKHGLSHLQERLGRLGISYNYAVKASSLREELGEIARTRRDLTAIIVPLCEGIRSHKEDFQRSISQLFSCPVIFFETSN